MKLARNLSLPILANISGRIDNTLNAARHTSPEDFKAFAGPHGSVEQTLPDTFGYCLLPKLFSK